MTPWDTKAFGFDAGELIWEGGVSPEGSLDLDELLRRAKKEQVGFLSCRVGALELSKAHILEEYQFRFIETTVNPRISLDRWTGHFPGDDLKPELATSRAIREIADEITGHFKFGRLQMDPRLPSEVGDKRYQNWLLASIDSSQLDVLQVLNQNKERVAFFLFAIDEDSREVAWLLNGVTKKFAGHGLGTAAWGAALRFHSLQGFPEVETTISTANIAALTIYARLGFSFTRPSVTFHWINEELTEMYTAGMESEISN